MDTLELLQALAPQSSNDYDVGDGNKGSSKDAERGADNKGSIDYDVGYGNKGSSKDAERGDDNKGSSKDSERGANKKDSKDFEWVPTTFKGIRDSEMAAKGSKNAEEGYNNNGSVRFKRLKSTMDFTSEALRKGDFTDEELIAMIE